MTAAPSAAAAPHWCPPCNNHTAQGAPGPDRSSAAPPAASKPPASPPVAVTGLRICAPIPAYRYWRRSSSSFSCVTNYREPVSRIISCLAYRHRTAMQGKCVADMDVGLLRVLLNRPDAFGNSCLNEPFRIMSGIRSDHFIDRLDECDDLSQNPGVRVDNHVNLELALQLTLKHASKCSPLWCWSPPTLTQQHRAGLMRRLCVLSMARGICTIPDPPRTPPIARGAHGAKKTYS